MTWDIKNIFILKDCQEVTQHHINFWKQCHWNGACSYWIFSIQWILVVIHKFEKSAFAMGFSYHCRAYLTWSSTSQFWFALFSLFFWYICQLHTNRPRFWHDANPWRRRRKRFYNNAWKTNKQSFLIQEKHPYKWNSDSSVIDSTAIIYLPPPAESFAYASVHSRERDLMVALEYSPASLSDM